MRALAAGIVGLALAAAAPAGAQTAVGSTAPDLVLRDQYDSTVVLRDWRGHVVLFVVGDRHGNQYMSAYARAVRERFPSADDVRIVNVAHLTGVPFFVKGSVRGRFRGTDADGRPKGSVVLDWDGALGREFGFRGSLTNVYVMDRVGVLSYAAAGRGLPADTQALLAALTDVVGTPSLGRQHDR